MILPRERVVIAAPASCPCCGSTRLCRLGESVTETAERIPASWKIIQTVREKVSCQDCETIAQARAPFHATPRGWAGPNLLAGILVDKFAQHLPLNRQCERFAREDLPVTLATVADQVGHACATLKPLLDLMARHVMAAERLHGDDTTVPVLARARPSPGGSGSMSATTAPLAARHRRRRCSTTRAIAAVGTPKRTWRAMAVSCRLTPMPAMAGSTPATASRAR